MKTAVLIQSAIALLIALASPVAAHKATVASPEAMPIVYAPTEGTGPHLPVLATSDQP